LDEIRQYQRYKTHLNNELINTRLEKLLYSQDLQIFRNNYLTNHIESINTNMSKYNKSIIDNERNIKKLNKVVDSSYELLCKLALKMNIYGIMKIQGQIKLLKEFPRHQELLDDFTKNYSYY
jgi:flagellar biosynthesis chaperone FliJ